MRGSERGAQKLTVGRQARLSIRLAVGLAGLLALVVAACAPPGTWPTYGGDRAHTGVNITDHLDPLTPAWTAPLDGAAVYGQPVVAWGRVFVATEQDDVYALDPHDGHVLWERNIGTPLTNVVANTGCGDIDPSGVTSTPVVDLRSGTVYVVGEVSNAGSPPAVHHELFGFNPNTGAVVRAADADPPLPAGESPLNLLQRAALTVANQRVYVGYGGNVGDCGHYHGWLVGVGQHPSVPNVSFEVAADGEGGAIWEPGGPAVDQAGNVYVTTGNSNPFPPQGGPDSKAFTESAVKLGPDLGAPRASFKDAVAGGDDDLASTAPNVLPDGDIFVAGKSNNAYVLGQPNLTRLATITNVCSGGLPMGANAYDYGLNSLYVPCRGSGLQQVKLSTDTTGWHAGGVDGPPIIVGGNLWALQYPSGTLEELNASTGAVLQTLQAGPVPTFAAPSAALGLLLVGTQHGVAAFAGPRGVPAPTPPARG